MLTFRRSTSIFALALLLAALARPEARRSATRAVAPVPDSSVTATPQTQTSAAGAGLGYYRFPALHGDTLIFTAEGDLWRIGVGGGVAQRLTTHPAEESRPAVSVDGKTLAFSAAYEGPTEVYTLSLDGGLPVRQTFEGGTALVVGWTPGGEVLFRIYRRVPGPRHDW